MKKRFFYAFSIMMIMLSMVFVSCGDDDESVSPSSSETTSHDYTARITFDDEIWNYATFTAIVTDTVHNKEVAQVKVTSQNNVIGWDSDNFNGKLQLLAKLKNGVTYPETVSFNLAIRVSNKRKNISLENQQINTFRSRKNIGKMLQDYFDSYVLSIKTLPDNDFEIDATDPMYVDDTPQLEGYWGNGTGELPKAIHFYTYQGETKISFKGNIGFINPDTGKLTSLPYVHNTSYNIDDENIVFKDGYAMSVNFTDPETGKRTTISVKWGKNHTYHISDDGNTLTMKDLDNNIERTYTREK